MAWTTPVTDWESSDYFNVADFDSIEDNALHVNGLFVSELGYSISSAAVTGPTTSTIGDEDALYQLNTLLENIERMRSWTALYLSEYLAGTLPMINTNWEIGNDVPSPNYNSANSWENTLLIMYNILNTWTPPTLSGDLELGGGGSLELGGGGNLELGA
jgi:hypothetical protein